MANIFEQRENYIYTHYADDVLDLARVTGWVMEFVEHPMFTAGTNVLWDATAIGDSTLSFGDMQAFGDFLLTIRERRGGGRSGFVTNHDLIFGLFRTHEMLNNSKFDYNYRVFREMAPAELWVAGDDDTD